MPGQGVLERFGTKLGPTVSVNKAPCHITTSSNRVDKGVNEECCGHLVSDRIPDNAVGEHVFHPGLIRGSLAGVVINS